MRRALIIVIGLAFVVAACGSDSDDDVATTVPTDTIPTDTIPPGDDGTDDASGTRPVDGEDAYAIANLEVTITHPDADDVTYTVSCLGDTATIVGSVDGVTGEAACVALKDPEVVRRLVQGVPNNQICTEQYGGPDIAAITGSLDGEAVDTSIDRANGCGIADWDFLLASVLPRALGLTE